MVVDLGRRPDMCSEKFRRHNQIGAVRFDVGMQCLLDTDRAVPGFDFDDALHFAVSFRRIELHLAHPEFRIGTEAKLDDVEATKVEAEDVNTAWLRGPAFAASGTVDIAVPHIGD